MEKRRFRILAVLVLITVAVALAVWAEVREPQDKDDDDEKPLATAVAPPESALPVAPPGKEVLYNFDADPAGASPKGFHIALTGGGGPPQWLVKGEDTAPSKPNVVAQTSTGRTDYRFPLLIADDSSFRDLDISVTFKAVSGKVDQAGGLVFRLKDANNYYIVRANALEDNYRLYHVIAGRRVQFAGSNFKVTSGVWHQLRVEAIGNKFTCYFDGMKKIQATDDSFKDAGRIGLWTKADSVTYFDDLKAVAK